MRLFLHRSAVLDVSQFVCSSFIYAGRQLVFLLISRAKRNVSGERCIFGFCIPSIPLSQKPIKKVMRSCHGRQTRPKLEDELYNVRRAVKDGYLYAVQVSELGFTEL